MQRFVLDMPGRGPNATTTERKQQSKEFIQIRCQMRKGPAGSKATDYWAEGTGGITEAPRQHENADLRMAEHLQREADENERNFKRLLTQEIRQERELLRQQSSLETLLTSRRLEEQLLKP